MLPFFALVIHSIFLILADSEDIHETSKEYDVQPDLTTDCWVAALESLKKHRLIKGEKGFAIFLSCN